MTYETANQHLRSDMRLAFLVALIGTLLPLAGAAQTGVSDDRVSLPEGPGSLEGIGDDVDIDPNMGSMSYAVPMNIPQGFPGLTPQVGVSYSSAAGSSVVGFGWSMPEPSIERLTLRGVPRYDAADEFEVDRGELLVHTATNGDGSQVYRARCEGGFVRYTWHDVGDGAEGYFVAERPDGTVCSYGADRAGNLVSTARVGSELGTYRYLPVTCWDGYDHHLDYQYDSYGGTVLVESIGYVFRDGDEPTYELTFAYEGREDWVSNATAGFEELLQHRLSEVSVWSNGTRRNRYTFAYEDYDTSGGFSRLVEVATYGVGDAEYPVRFAFAYSRALGEVCTDDTCDGPFVVDMGSIGVNLQSGAATLVDINGDALPDLIDSARPDDNAHRIHLNTLVWDEETDTFESRWATSYDSAVATNNTHDIASAYVQPMDVNGDGLTDLIRTNNGEVLINRGSGDWESNEGVFDGNSLAEFSEDFMRSVHFLDYDNDRNIDLIRATGAEGAATIYRNTPDANGPGLSDFVLDDGADSTLGAGFDSDTLELNDINGDGLLDLVQVQESSVRYRLNLGYGHWSDAWDSWREITASDLSLNGTQRIVAELEDLNGDAMADLVLVESDRVRVWINRNGDHFDPVQDIDGDAVGGEGFIPERTGTTTVLFADMNGNGSSDVVWVTSAGQTYFLELFPVRPNLLSRVENGLGLVIDVDYGTSVEHMSRDGGPGAWSYRLPFPMIVVDRIDEWDRLTDVHQVVEFDYHDAYYDGVEKQFRGYETVNETTLGDESISDGGVDYVYDVGVSNPCRAGLLSSLTQLSSGAVSVVQTDTYDNCTVAEVENEGLLFEVQHLCLVATRAEIREGRAESEWVVQRQTWQYDGYGQATRHVDEGVVSVGGSTTCGACDRADGEYGQACGAGCFGDEMITESDYVVPGEDTGGIWILGLEWRERIFPEDGTDRYQEIRTYYDGPAFEGLPEGHASNGFVSRITQRANEDGDLVTALRASQNDDGNSAEEIGPLGEIDGDWHHRTFEYDDTGLRITSSSLHLGDRGYGQDVIRAEMRYDDIWGNIATGTYPTLYRDGVPATTPATRSYAYDAFGRREAIVEPGGDTVSSPTYAYTWDVGSPVSSVTVRERSEVGGPQDVLEVQCLDGRGRVYQTRTMRGPSDYLVSGFEVYNIAGMEREVFQAYASESGECDTSAPTGVPSTTMRYDAMGRLIGLTHPDGAEEAIAYLPSGQLVFDENDMDPSSAHYDTPTWRLYDGQERIVATGRTDGDHEIEWFRYTYDATSGVARTVDPMGNERVQSFDLMRQVTRVVDPDRGTATFEYNADGDVVRQTNGAGETLVREYDGAGRLLRVFDEDDPAGSYYEISWDLDEDCPSVVCTNTANRIVGVRYPTPDGIGEDWAGYNPRGDVTLQRRNIGDVTLERTREYDNLGRMTRDTLPGGFVIEPSYDGRGSLTEVPGFIDAIAYDDHGSVESIAFTNGTTFEPGYDLRRRLNRMTTTGPDRGSIVDREVDLDAAGLVLSVTDNVVNGSNPTASATYTYDAFDRLIRADLEGGVEVLDYTYDGADNILSRVSSLGEASPVHDGARIIDDVRPHAVVQAGDRTYAYDDAGRMTRRGDDELGWDAFGRHVTTSRDGAVVGEHVFIDADTRAMTITPDTTVYYLGDDFELVDGVASYALAVAGSTVARVEYPDLATEVYSDIAPEGGDGMITAADAWLAYAGEQEIIELGEGASDSAAMLRASASLALIDYDERRTWLHRDQVDCIAAVTDADGAVIERTVLYPFGSLRWSSTNNGERNRFTDKRTDPGSDLVLIGLRDYDPHLGRWIAPDVAYHTVSAGELDRPWEALGTYVYGLNSPLSVQDENGAWSLKSPFGQKFTAVLTVGLGFSAGALLAIGTGGAIIPAAIAGAVVGGLGYLAWKKIGNFVKGVTERGNQNRGSRELSIRERRVSQPQREESGRDVSRDVSGLRQVNDSPEVQGETLGRQEGEPMQELDLDDGPSLNDYFERMHETGDDGEPEDGVNLGEELSESREMGFGDNLNEIAVGMDLIMDDIVDQMGEGDGGFEGPEETGEQGEPDYEEGGETGGEGGGERGEGQ